MSNGSEVHSLAGGGKKWIAPKAIKGRAPVHVVWTRDDDLKAGFID